MATYYWVGGTGTWDNASTANWSASSGGAAGSGPPLAADTVIFDSASGTGTCTTAATAVAATATLNSATLGLTLGANLTMAGAFTLTQGSLNINDFNLTVLNFVSNNANTRSIAFGATGSIILTIVGGIAWDIRDLTEFSCTGSKQVVVQPTGGASSTTIYHRGAAATEAKAVSFKFVTSSIAGLTLTGTSIFLNLDLSQAAGTGAITLGNLTIYGDLSLRSTNNVSASATALTFSATSGTKTLTTAGVSLDIPIVFNGAGGAWQLADSLTIGSTRTLTLTNGTLDGNGQNVSIGSFALASGTKTLTLGSGTWSVAGNWDANTNVTNLTVSASTGTINMTSASDKTFAGGAKAWPTLNQGGAGALTIQQSNNFANITNSVQPATITLTSGTTQTVSSFGASGTAGNLITLNASTPGSRATLSDSTGTNSVSFVSLQDINATGGATWDAFLKNGNVDAGNNLGWDFRAMMRKMFLNIFRPTFRPVF